MSAQDPVSVSREGSGYPPCLAAQGLQARGHGVVILKEEGSGERSCGLSFHMEPSCKLDKDLPPGHNSSHVPLGLGTLVLGSTGTCNHRASFWQV